MREVPSIPGNPCHTSPSFRQVQYPGTRQHCLGQGDPRGAAAAATGQAMETYGNYICNYRFYRYGYHNYMQSRMIQVYHWNYKRS